MEENARFQHFKFGELFQIQLVYLHHDSDIYKKIADLNIINHNNLISKEFLTRLLAIKLSSKPI